MSINTTVTGNLTAEPELRYTQTGKPVANFTVAHTPRKYDKQAGQWVDGDPTFIRCNLWGNPAEHIAALPKGCRVVVVGDLQQRSYETREGEKRTTFELQVDEVAVSARFGTVTPPVRAASGSKPQPGTSGWGNQNQASTSQNNAWAAPTDSYNDEPPF